MPVAPPNHVGSNPAEEFRIHKGLYESNNRPKKSLEILADRRVKFQPVKLKEGKPAKKPQQVCVLYLSFVSSSWNMCILITLVWPSIISS
jgi:hypothetical protein